ncbi:MAG TPA: hypothetical protein HPP76_04500 [Desulfuromonadales bacterium]|nr:hypothetical protein [Desulfuromonadales bacterium]
MTYRLRFHELALAEWNKLVGKRTKAVEEKAVGKRDKNQVYDSASTRLE